MYLSAIVLAAGKGLRLRARNAKPLVKINSCPAIIHCLNTLNKHPLIREIIVVANRRNLPGITSVIKRYRINKFKRIVLGGIRRQDSVLNGLKAADRRSDFVLIHDAARPFIGSKCLSAAVREAQKSKAAIVGVPVKATIKKVVSRKSSVVGKYVIAKTLNRENLWEAQTPQVFKKDLILKAYEKFGDIEVTDDAMLVEKLGQKVSIVLGSYNNIKVTTPEDLAVAEAISKSYKL